jgi:hypothetical protein
MSVIMDPTLPEVQADTEVYREGDGYQRTILFSVWKPDNTRDLIKIDLRVDRLPGNSHFSAFLWTDNGWLQKARPHNVNYWHMMPGFRRWQTAETEKVTRRVAARIAHDVARGL